MVATFGNLHTAPDGEVLEGLLRHAAHDPAWRPAFYRRLLESRVLALVPEKPIICRPNGEEVIRFVQWKRIDGTAAIPCFSSAPRLYEAVPEGAQCVVIDVPMFLSLTRGALLHLNPFSEFNLEIPSEDIERLVIDGALFLPQPFHVEAERKIVQCPLTDPPLAMIDALSSLYRQLPNVTAAYLACIQGMYERDQPSLLLGVEIDGDPEPVVRDSGLVIRDTYEGLLPLDITRVGSELHLQSDWFAASLCVFQRSWTLVSQVKPPLH